MLNVGNESHQVLLNAADQVFSLVSKAPTDSSTLFIRALDSVVTDSQSIEEPKTYLEATQSKGWRESIKKEINSLNESNAWKLVPIPKDKKLVKSRFVFKVKRSVVNDSIILKTRIVAKGFSQVKGEDYGEVFAPVIRFDTLRLLLAMGADSDLEVHTVDFDTAFLNGKLVELVYMELPDGLREEYPGMCVLMLRAIYGLKQSPRVWNQELTNHLINNGFERSYSDPCLFIFKESSSNNTNLNSNNYNTPNSNNKTMVNDDASSSFLSKEKGVLSETIGNNIFNSNIKPNPAMGVYVDDSTIVASSKVMPMIKKVMSSRFKIKDLGPISELLQLEVSKDSNGIALGQSSYIKSMLKEFNMSDAKPSPTPFDCLVCDSNSPPLQDNKLYRKAIGCLNWLSVATRPDISYSVNVAAQYVESPTTDNWNKIKRIFRYLKGSIDAHIFYASSNPLLIEGYSDSSYANAPGKKSIGGYCFKIRGGVFCWSSKKQSIVATSPMEAELIALTNAAKQGMWLKKICDDLNIPYPIIDIYEDNQSTIKFVNGSEFSSRSKHIDVRYYFVRDLIERGEAKVSYIPTSQMTADIFTKGLGKELHLRHCLGMGMRFSR